MLEDKNTRKLNKFTKIQYQNTLQIAIQNIAAAQWCNSITSRPLNKNTPEILREWKKGKNREEDAGHIRV